MWGGLDIKAKPFIIITKVVVHAGIYKMIP